MIRLWDEVGACNGGRSWFCFVNLAFDGVFSDLITFIDFYFILFYIITCSYYSFFWEMLK